jgi:hypothetical protein
MLLCADHRDRNIGATMKTFSTVALSMFAGAILVLVQSKVFTRNLNRPPTSSGKSK